jgi:hypothetical protein
MTVPPVARLSRLGVLIGLALWESRSCRQNKHEKCFGTHRDADIEKAFLAGTFLLRLKARNLVAPLAELSEAQLANALVEVKPDLAALIACHALEMQIRRLAADFGLPSYGPGLPLEQIIDSLPNFGPVNPVRKAKWRMLKDARNEFIHCGEMPGIQERKILIEEVLQLEKDLRERPAESKMRAER